MKYYVLYDQKWIRDRLPTKTTGDEFRFKKIKKPPIDNFEGQEVFDIFQLIQLTPAGYDGVICVMSGDNLKEKGKNLYGKHYKRWKNGKKFSVMMVDGLKGSRNWKLGLGGWYLGYSNRKRGDYPMLEYTFDHEIGHSWAWIKGKTDFLHAFVKLKRYDYFWNFAKKFML